MIILSFFISVLSLFSFYPSEPIPAERWLVELEEVESACLKEWWQTQAMDHQYFFMKKLPVGNWWVLKIPQSARDMVQSLTCVRDMREDQKIEWRDRVPNDPNYIHQADMNLIGMPGAWSVTTGGLTSRGDSIVVAVIDDGFQTDHPDLIDNIWINRQEIPADGIDNDLNGYVDDRVGYNVSTEDDTHPVKSHGTSVCGVIGAVGNNTTGVSGVNWDVKLMLISGADFESDVIMAYQYVIDMRELYRQTNGAKGAFIVVTNLSGGINNAWADDHPLWCEMYDKLGQKGILSVTAAPNQSISVDVEGDMPTTCASPYMIAVTNVDADDVLVGNAGYGASSIDIGAMGHGTFTTASGDQYKNFPGTSAAAPHVAGAIALMYGTPCVDFLADIETDPVGIAEDVRDIIFSTATDNNSLNEITTTGRRIQVNKALLATTSENCGAPVLPGVTITSVQPNPSRSQKVQVYFEMQGEVSGAFFEVFSSDGAKVLEIGIDDDIMAAGFVEIEGSALPAGVYHITLRNGGDKMTRKLVIVN